MSKHHKNCDFEKIIDNIDNGYWSSERGYVDVSHEKIWFNDGWNVDQTLDFIFCPRCGAFLKEIVDFKNSYCINLPERTDRWEESQKEFKFIDIQVNHFPAIKAQMNGKGFNAYSFIELFKIAKKEKFKNIAIFEDDVKFINRDMFNTVIQDFNRNIIAKGLPWDIFYLGYNCHERLYAKSKYTVGIRNCFTLHAAVYNESIYDSIIRAEGMIDNDFIIDVYIRDFIQPHGRCYGANPILATQRPDFSDIENKEVNYDFILERFNKFVPHLKEK